jgi:hypothetical protein
MLNKIQQDTNKGTLITMTQHHPLFTTAFLLSVWAKSYQVYCIRKFVSLLLALKRTDNSSLLQQLVNLDSELAILAQTAVNTEQHLNQLTYQLYGLTVEEIGMVERG